MQLEHVECGVQDAAARGIALTERSQSLSNVNLLTANRTPAYGFAYLPEVRRDVVSERVGNGCLALASQFGFSSSATGARHTAGLTEDDDHDWGQPRTHWMSDTIDVDQWILVPRSPAIGKKRCL